MVKHNLTSVPGGDGGGALYEVLPREVPPQADLTCYPFVHKLDRKVPLLYTHS